ncbi:hypothetical protein EHS25_003253 [Saitozyma podzolica]|uniref:ER membrane protein complex subunit 4 n=1 Tax=Saitozyma podzolica TaxID=1890683 RepID=A0A427Y8J9_9TREE|nr:hypothetical protein EHS25_003253 [Saitozyma podzolica]
MAIRLDYTLAHPPKSAPPNPPGYLPVASAKDAAKVAPAKSDAIALKARKATDLKMRRAWELALSPAKSLPMQAIMLYFSGSGIQIFSLGMIFMLLTSPISAVLNIFRAFEAFRPTPLKTGEEPSYAPLVGPMITYIGAQALV